MKLMEWAYSKSLWSVHYCIACCSLEIGASMSPFYDAERFGFMPMPSPRQADMIVLGGLLTKKMLRRFARIYFQMPEPKMVLAVGACPLSGGIYHGSYSVIQNLPDIVPINLYVAGCPPRADAILEGIKRLRENWSKLRLDAREKREKEAKLLQILEEKRNSSVVVEGDVSDDCSIPHDEAGSERLGYLTKILGKIAHSVKELGDYVEVYVQPKDLKRALAEISAHVKCWLSFITAVDYVEDGCLELVYSIWNAERKEPIYVKTRIPRDKPYIDSVKDIFPVADFYEREVWEMFGVVFKGHGDLRVLLLDENWSGKPPLLKDFGGNGGEPR